MELALQCRQLQCTPIQSSQFQRCQRNEFPSGTMSRCQSLPSSARPHRGERATLAPEASLEFRGAETSCSSMRRSFSSSALSLEFGGGPESRSGLARTASSVLKQTAPVASHVVPRQKKVSRRKRAASLKKREAEALELFLQRQDLKQAEEEAIREKMGPNPYALAESKRPALSNRLCGFSPSFQTGIDALLEAAALKPHDTFYDLGCGDGRVVLSVVEKFACRGVGVDLNGSLIEHAKSQALARFHDKPDLLSNASFIQQDIGRLPLDDARAVYIYMSEDALETLLSRVLPCTNIQDGTLIYTTEFWPHTRNALRNVKWVSTDWPGQLHCYEWRGAYGKRERLTFGG